MKKRLLILMTLLLSVAASFAFSKWMDVERRRYKVDSVEKEGVSEGKLIKAFNASCASPTGYGIKNVKHNEATIYWEDGDNSAWEYYMVPYGSSFPTGSGTPTSLKEVVVTKDNNGDNLTASTEYEYYIRSVCDNGEYGDWEGPFDFKTLCNSFNLPFSENFNTDSASRDCWVLNDVDLDGFADWNGLENKWELSSNDTYEGNGGMRFHSSGWFGNFDHDDWLISPTLNLTGGLYALTFYVKTDGSNNNEFEVLLSDNGTDITSFTQVLIPNQIYKETTYAKKVAYIEGITGAINIAWHVKAKNATTILIDLVNVEETGCKGPENIEYTGLEKDRVTYSWDDDDNTNWEYYVTTAGAGAPTGSGTLSSSKTVTVTRLSGSGGANLQPNTEYEFYVRSNCGNGTSIWAGPFYFRTPCADQPLPFWEGFNSDSETVDCWSIIDNNGDGNQWGENVWRYYDWGTYEGDRMADMSVWDSGAVSDDWLISPLFKLDNTTTYILKYHYKTSNYNNEFEVLMSTSGVGIGSFTDVVVPRKVRKTGDSWKEEIAYVKGVNAEIALAWHVTTTGYSDISIDNVFFEEFVGCPMPLNLDVKDVEKNKATIVWTDEMGAVNYEYVLRKRSKSKAPSGSGVSTSNKESVVTQDGEGNALESNTEYEFFVRSKCSDGTFSEWNGPFRFFTACDKYNVPFWEGFNTSSTSQKCWTIVDNNGDGVPEWGDNMWFINDWNAYEGNGVIRYSTYSWGTVSDDWLISPILVLDASKLYRLKFHVLADTFNENEFEVLASNNGLALNQFNKVIIPSEVYKLSAYVEKKVFFTGIGGDVNIAWHANGEDAQGIYIDNVYVEEVLGCPEPLDIEIDDIETNQFSVSWTDAFGATGWEYFVQEEGGGLPAGNGVSTSVKTNTIHTDHSGQNLKPNTDYEFYVRTVCGNGEFSIWAGPYLFTTACDSFSLPFWDGFNTDSRVTRCWTIVDGNGDMSEWGENVWQVYDWERYEGDRCMYFSVWDWMGTVENDDWLISPTINMAAGQYVLKYHYKSSSYENARFEVVLSSKGLVLDEFTHTIVGEKTYNNDNWQEEVVFFNGVSGGVNLAWHLTTVGSTVLALDNVFIKEVETCPEPYYVKVTGQTSSSIDIEWEQLGTTSGWEIIVVEYGEDETAMPIKTMPVTGTATSATITGLDSGKGYTIYVRAKCEDGNSHSDWSTPVHSGTKIANDNCAGAVTIPVNSGQDCVEKVRGSLLGATPSGVASPSCGGGMSEDVWYEFTATSESHVISVDDVVNLGGGYIPTINGVIYDQSCTAIGATAVTCFSLSSYRPYEVLKGLIAGQKYYVRLSAGETNIIYNLCITTVGYLDVSLSGDKYTVEELVKEVLVVTECDLVSNISYSTGTMFGSNNGIGYFEGNGSNFRFEEGIILATNGVQYASGPGNSPEGSDSGDWRGDVDLKELLEENDLDGNIYNASVLEFDFIPIVDTIKFDFIFASNEYGPSYQCRYSDVFAFFLTDLETGEVTNLAVVPGTDIPISVTTIRSAKYQGSLTCGDENEEYFDVYYGESGSLPQNNPINYSGMTVPLTAMSAVQPGRKYHIKMAIADYLDTGVNSAVFLKAGSFDLGTIDLGADLLVETGNALCDSDSSTIRSGVAVSEDFNTIIEWYKDGELMDGENEPDLEIKESGTYSIHVKYPDLSCESMGSVRVEIYPPISRVVNEPVALSVCRNSLSSQWVDLSQVEEAMFMRSGKEDYTTHYYLDDKAAEEGSDQYIDTMYEISEFVNKELYVRVEDKRTGCYEVFVLIIRAEKGDVPQTPSDVSVCAEYVFSSLDKDQYYYTESGGKGIGYKAGEVLNTPGKHKIYILQLNGDGGCYEEVSFVVDVTAPVVADVFEDVSLSCELYELQPLSECNKYFTEPNGGGIELYAGMEIPLGQTIYVYAESDDTLCVDESSFTVTYEDCPIPRGISPNGDGLNDTFDLSRHGVESIKIYNRWGTEVYSHGFGYMDQWYGQSKNDQLLPDGTYYYVIIAHGKTRTGWVQINR